MNIRGSILKYVKLILAGLLGLHFTIIAISLLDENPIAKSDAFGMSRYFKYFYQNWKMFSPPPNFNEKIYFQYILYSKNHIDTTPYYDVIAPMDNSHWKGNLAAARVSYFLFNCAQEINQANVTIQQAALSRYSVTDSLGRKKFVEGRLNRFRPYIYLQQYSVYMFKKLNRTSVDSVAGRFKVVQFQFPDFDHRNLDYYNLKNYKSYILASPFYKIL